MSRDAAENVIRSHVIWAMGAGLIPVPLVDFAAVTAIQLDMLKELSLLYGAEYSQSTGKAFVSAITGTTLARLGASLVKGIPGIGTILGGASMAITSGASTYAVGQVAVTYFSGSKGLDRIDPQEAKQAYDSAFERGKKYASDLEKNKSTTDKAADIYQSLEKLGKLKEQGVITEAEFLKKKQDLLDRL